MQSSPQSENRLARARLTFTAEPADPVMGALVRLAEPAEVLSWIDAGMIPASVAGYLQRTDRTLGGALSRWRRNLRSAPDAAALAAYERAGIRLLCPGQTGWPGELNDLDDAAPYALWVRGDLDLAACTVRSVAITGTRAATAYGTHVASQLAADLASQAWTIVSGAAYGIDAAAHRGALAAADRGLTIAVLAGGVNRYHPAGHSEMLHEIARCGLAISDSPPDHPVSRTRFLARCRIIAALSTGTVIVEAGMRGGAMNTAEHALRLGLPLMAVPGPVTSTQSSGCHELIRTHCATCVTDAREVSEVSETVHAHE
jgi:DNA processing protein